MANELINQLNDILSDKNTNLLPENLKEGVTCLGITGTFQGGSGEYGKITINKANISNVRVENLSGAGYNFELTDDGYYTSTNKGRDNTACVGKLYFTVNTDDEVKAEILCSSEQSFDYAQISKVDTTTAYGTSNSAEADSNTLFSTKGTDYTTPKEVSFGTLSKGEHYVYIKYRKDSSSSQDLDQLKIKMQLGQSTEEVNVKLYTSVEDLKADTSLKNKDFGLVVSSNANHFMSALYQWVNNEWVMSYDLATPTSIDNDLKPENILTGIDILGVEGTALNIDNSRINVTHKDIRAGKYTFNRAGQPIIGSLNVPQIEYSDTATQLEKIELNIDDLTDLNETAYCIWDRYVMYVKNNRLSIIKYSQSLSTLSTQLDIDNSIDSISVGVKDYFNPNTVIILLSGNKGYFIYEFNYLHNTITYKNTISMDRTYLGAPVLNDKYPLIAEGTFNVFYGESVLIQSQYQQIFIYKIDDDFSVVEKFISNAKTGSEKNQYYNSMYFGWVGSTKLLYNATPEYKSTGYTRKKYMNNNYGYYDYYSNAFVGNKLIACDIVNDTYTETTQSIADYRLSYNPSETYLLRQSKGSRPYISKASAPSDYIYFSNYSSGEVRWLSDDIYVTNDGVFKIKNDRVTRVENSIGIPYANGVFIKNGKKILATSNNVSVAKEIVYTQNTFYNTQTANVTKEDIPLGKIAYTNTGKIIGTLQTDTGKNYTELLTTANNIANTTLEDDSTTITFDVDTEMRCLQKALKILKGVV